jgi:hypothetical protein
MSGSGSGSGGLLGRRREITEVEAAATAALVAAAAAAPTSPSGRAMRSATGKGDGRPVNSAAAEPGRGGARGNPVCNVPHREAAQRGQDGPGLVAGLAATRRPRKKLKTVESASASDGDSSDGVSE